MTAILFLCATVVARPAEREATTFEAEVAAAVKWKDVTIVHFWASWCPNCAAEHAEDRWKGFLAANPEVRVIFISIWGSGPDDERMLERYGLTEHPNFVALRHPNQSRRADERVSRFLDLPVTWIPTTWIFRDGALRYALNYGEVHFDILAQLVADAAHAWPR